jgi:cytoskeletal protein RodZ
MKQTVGEQLRSARESRGISLVEVVKAIHIRLNYLQELENDHPEMFNSEAQASGFLRLYASFLGIPSTPLIEQWQKSIDTESEIEEEQEKADEIEEGASVDEPALKDSPSIMEDHQQDLKDGEEKKGSPFSLRDLLDRVPKLSRLISFRKKEARSTTETVEEILLESESLEEPSDSVQQPALSSGEIFSEIGSALRERRLALELTLSDVERFTNVKRMYLDAMEDGRFDELPSTVQGRGLLNNYSKFLALDDSSVMDSYARALQSLRDERAAQKKRPMQSPLSVKLNIPEKWRQILNPDLIIGGFFIVALFAFIIWGGAQVFGGADPTPTEAPSISEVLQQSSTPTPLLDGGGEEDGDSANGEATQIPGVTVAESTPTQIATVNAAPLQLYIIAHDRAYVRIVVDGFEAFEGRVLPENVYTYSAENTIELVTGNGAALEVYFNQEYLGNMGNVGEVVNITFSLQGLSTPTPKSTPTPTVEPAPVDVDDT